ncbi:MAG: chemotaxis protein CheW [Nitrospirota bacterium]|nr:chemotaxis protein CheW [Nitrospirota bacterium]
MTRTILQFTLQGRPFGVWESDVASVVRAHSLHHLPLTPACVAGMAVIEDRGTTIIDTGVCVGLQPQRADVKASFLLIGDGSKRTGYRVEGSVETVPCEDDHILPLPDQVRTEILRSCAVPDRTIIPIIEIRQLQDRISRGIIDVPEPSDSGALEKVQAVDQKAVRVVSIADERLCVTGTGSVLVPAGAGDLCEIPGPEGRPNRLLLHKGRVVPLLPVAERLGMESFRNFAAVLVMELEGNFYGLTVAADHGLLEEDAFTMKPLPPLVQGSCFRNAVIHQGEVIPLIDLAGIVTARSGTADELPLAERYRPAPSFPMKFQKDAVNITEVALFGGKHGIPQDEVREVLPYSAPRRVPNAPAIVLGVIERSGKVLPVLDLAVIFGRRSPVTDTWKLVHLENGDFEALVAVEQILGDKQLSLDVQKQVPIVLPYDVLYGCYLDENVVRLIVNVQSLTVHFEETTIRDFMSTMSPVVAEPPVIMPATANIGQPRSDDRMDRDTGISSPPDTREQQSSYEHQPALYASGNREMPKAAQSWSDRVGTGHQAYEQPVSKDNPPVPESARSIDDENARMRSEKERLDAEQAAQRAEDERIKAEQARVQAERERHEADAALKAEEQRLQRERVREEEARRAQEEKERLERAAAQAESDRTEKARLQAEEEKRFEEERVKLREAHESRERERRRKEQEMARESAPGPRSADDRRMPIPDDRQEQESSRRAESPQVPGRTHAARNIMVSLLVAAVLLLVFFFPGAGKKDRAPDVTSKARSTASSDHAEHSDKIGSAQKDQEPPLVLAVPRTMPVPDPAVYVVAKGDTLWSIAKRFTGNPLNYPRVAKDNSIATPDLIYPGQRIRLKKE